MRYVVLLLFACVSLSSVHAFNLKAANTSQVCFLNMHARGFKSFGRNCVSSVQRRMNVDM